MFNVGTQEFLLLLLVVLLLFGAKRIPEISRALGRGLGDFREALSGVEREIKGEGPPRRGPDTARADRAFEGDAPVRENGTRGSGYPGQGKGENRLRLTAASAPPGASGEEGNPELGKTPASPSDPKAGAEPTRGPRAGAEPPEAGPAG